MPEQESRRIVQELLDEPHIAGRRISVRTIHERVEGRGLDPQTVADRFDLDVADVYRALTYYYDHPREMQRLHEERDALTEKLREEIASERPDDVTPPNE